MTTPPPIDVVQHRLSERRCILCGSQSVMLNPHTGFPEHVCGACQQQNQKTRRDEKRKPTR